MRCPNCAHENGDQARFCISCGFDLDAHRSAVTPAASLSAGAATEPPRAPPPSPSSPGGAPAPSASAKSPVGASPPSTGVAPVCPFCGTTNAASMKFCGACGGRLDGAQAPPVAAARASAPQVEAAEPSAARTMFMHASALPSIQERRAKLVAIDPSGQEGMTFTLHSGETVCGRVNGVILFFEDPTVSPTHCLFRFQDGKLSVLDQESLNGVYLRLRAEHVLVDGDFLRVGRQLFRFDQETSLAPSAIESPDDNATLWGSPDPGAFGRLTQVLEDGTVGDVRLLVGDSCEIGREHGQIVFPRDGFVSGRHCQFAVRDGRPLLKDLDSSNGTYVRVRASAPLVHGDVVLVGNQMLRVEIL